MGSFTLTEGLTDIAPFAAFIDQAQKTLAALPPKDTAKPSDYIKAVASILTDVAPLADMVADQVKS